MTRGSWSFASPEQLTLGQAIRQYANHEDLDVSYGVMLITLGDPKVSLQYLGPNKVNHVDLVLWLCSIAEELRQQPMVIEF